MFNLCRLCLKASFYHKNIYLCQSAESKPAYEVINYVYDLEICEGDGLPEYVCRECFSKVEEFLCYKKNAQKARSELVLLKWQLEKAHVKEEEDNCEEIREEYTGNGEGDGLQEGQQKAEDYVNLIVCKTEPLDDVEEDHEWRNSSDWAKEETSKHSYKEEVKSEDASEVHFHTPSEHPGYNLATHGEQPSVEYHPRCRENGSNDRETFHLEGLGMKLQPEPSGSTLQRKKPGEVEVWNPGNVCFPSSSLPGKYMYPCTICYKEFTSEHYLQKHYLTHRKDKTHRCSLCGEVFKEVAALRRHRNVHKDRKEMICVHCGKKFYIKSMLVVHMRAHTGDRPFKCERCGKGFAQNGNLQSHYLVHMRRDKSACQVCGRTFLHEKHLSTHMALHSGERPHECQVCGKAFAQQSVLKAHVAKHGGRKRFACDTCGKTFVKMADKQRHEVVHGK